MFHAGGTVHGGQRALTTWGLCSEHLARIELTGDHVVTEERLLDEPRHRQRPRSMCANRSSEAPRETSDQKIS